HEPISIRHRRFACTHLLVTYLTVSFTTFFLIAHHRAF
ncbi:hypothetical protein ABIF30_009406, partial [Bradyrhizobium elkanii]